MKSQLGVILTFLATTLALTAAPRLVVSTASLAPESQIDLVFDSPVIEISQLGKTVDNDWLEIEPKLAGKLVWKAQNIAKFIPEQAPVIGKTYTFSIPKNLKHLDESPIPAGKFTTLESEQFRVITANSPNKYSSEYVAATGEWLLTFNWRGYG